MEENNVVVDDNSLSLADIFITIKKWFWFLVLTTLVGGLIVGIYAFLISKPSYKSVGGIMVQVQAEITDNTNTVESQRLVQSTIDILTKIDIVQERTSLSLEQLGYDVPTNEIKSNMNVSNSNGSLIIQISYISKDKELTELTLNTIIDSLIAITNDDSHNMSSTLKNNIVSLYVSPATDNSTSKILLVFVGLMLGGIIGLVVVAAVEFSSTSYKFADELERDFKIEVIGKIPMYEIKAVNEHV